MIVSRVISGYAYNIIKRILPKISETEKAALNSGSVSIEGDIFAGRVDISSIVSKYNISLRADELSFLNNETNKLCHMIDNNEIEKRQNLSPETWEYIKQNNFMGLVIPKHFNGKGFSPHAHSLIVEKIAGRNIATAVSNGS
jgi:acyl-CoA dehydrogenase